MTEQKLITWVDVVNGVQKDFVEIADTHKAVKWREECEFALQALTKNMKLSQCTTYSVESAIKNVAAVGLSLNPAYGFAYLIPESQKRGTEWIQECQLRISFTGLIKLATDSGSIKVVKAEIVRENDVFEYRGPMQEPTHTIKTPFKPDERGAPVGVYCIAITHEDRALVDLIPWDEVMTIKSKAKTQGVWNDWPEEMAKKAVIKRASKQWPKTDQNNRLQKAVAVANEHEGSVNEAYTTEDFDKFHHYLESGTDIEFTGFVRSLDELVYNDLFNSFGKNLKTAGKKKVSEKERRGLHLLNGIKHDMQSDDEETKQEALTNLNDIEKRVAIKFAQEVDQSIYL